MSASSRFRRPASLAPYQIERLEGDLDPAVRRDAAHATAALVVGSARERADPALTARLTHLVEVEGLAAVAALWADADPVSLPGVLWRLYVIREWVRRDPTATARSYRSGAAAAPVAEAVVGVGGVPEPADFVALADTVLSGFFVGDLGVALDRASAFLRILATGAALDADSCGSAAATAMTRQAAKWQRTARDLEVAAEHWRAGSLE